MKFRHELKYLINYGDAELIKQRLRTVLREDSHTIGGKYHIRSLYFDDYFNTAYYDKLDGADGRKKYRIRLYNLEDNFIRLECKIKSGAYISKLSAPVTKAETDKIFEGDYGFLLSSEHEICRQFYYECVSNVMRPKVYVDYEREPYIMESGDVRITFDSDVRGAYPCEGITGEGMVFGYVLDPGKLIMEVKFTEFLPEIVRQILPSRAMEQSAVSKYVLCCDAVSQMTSEAIN